jgi:hypothetical protein
MGLTMHHIIFIFRSGLFPDGVSSSKKWPSWPTLPLLSLIIYSTAFLSCRHGINKTLTRRAQKFKQATGIAAEGTQDAFFDALYVKFEEQQETARQLARDVQGWLRHVKENFESMYQLAVSLEDLYTSWGGVTVKSLERIKAFKDCAVSLTTSLSRELVNPPPFITCMSMSSNILNRLPLCSRKRWSEASFTHA